MSDDNDDDKKAKKDRARDIKEMLCRAVPILIDAFSELDTDGKMTLLSVTRDRGVYNFLENLSIDEFTKIHAALTPENAESFVRLYKLYAAESRGWDGDGPPAPRGPFPGLMVIQGGKMDRPKEE